MPSDADFMHRAIELAMRGRGHVEPNPMVGCVVVKDGRVIAEGYHEKFGGPHAEANALAASAGHAAGATVYVSLEPCCHKNKNTPPCTDALIAAKVARVVVACQDPNLSVSGQGLKQLRDAGIAVESGILASEAKQLNAAYFKRVLFHRPYVTLKWAQTADGKIAGPGGARIQITNRAATAQVHSLRGRCDAILVGIGTVLMDDPLLAARAPTKPGRPIRIALDHDLRIPPTSQLVKTAGEHPLLIAAAETAVREKADLVSQLRSAGAMVIALPSEGSGLVSLPDLLDQLAKTQVTHLIVEPGVQLVKSFLDQNLADRVWLFQSPKRIDADDAPAAAKIEYPMTGHVTIEGDELREYLNPASPVFFSLQRSADFAPLVPSPGRVS
jgi:diaminohydroxyphosphoribosylaminopyrimidine deaminase/5-amino-6-(5-phosphoribosylamino)uracil reductase